MIRLSKSCLSKKETLNVNKVLKKEFLGMGAEVKKFEDECYHELKKYVGKDSNAIIQRILKYYTF